MKNIILKNVPTTVLAADADIEELRKMLEGDSTLVLNDDGTVGEKGKQNGKSRLGDVPSSKLGISLREFLSKSDDEDSEQDENSDETSTCEKKPLGDVPQSKLGAVQWYTRPEMQQQLAFEKAGMLKYIGTPKWGENCGTLDDGRMFFKVRQRIRADRRDGTPLYNEIYDLMLVYQPNHPNEEWGTSIHVYPIGHNNVERMQKRVDESERTPKDINHLLTDDDGFFYLCTSQVDDFGTSYYDKRGVPTAETALLVACKWLHNFECGLLSQKHWNKFQEHKTL